jgi:hypothetical protein
MAADTFIPVSFRWAAGDVSLAAYIQASLARVEAKNCNVSALGAVRAGRGQVHGAWRGTENPGQPVTVLNSPLPQTSTKTSYHDLYHCSPTTFSASGYLDTSLLLEVEFHNTSRFYYYS